MSQAKNLAKMAQNVTSTGVLSSAAIQGGGGSSNFPTISAITYTGDDTAVNTAGGDTVTLTGTNFNTGVKVIINGVEPSSVTRVSSTQITFPAPAMATGSYIVYVVNTDGSTALAVPGIQYSPTPTWTTAAGSLGSPKTQISFSSSVNSTGDAPITYSIVSGALPSGLTLNSSTGAITGTTPTIVADTTYNFTIRATDAQNQDTNRAFSITVLVNNITPTVEYLVVAGGGGGGGGAYGTSGGGGGGGGTLTGTLGVSASSTYTIAVGAGGTGGTNSSNSTATGTQGNGSTIGTAVITFGGGGGGTYSFGPTNGGSGGGGGGDGPGLTSYIGGKGVYPGSSYYSQTRQGYDGGNATHTDSPYNSGGGGGAGGPGSAGGTDGGNGGIGISSSISGVSTYYAGGGGAGSCLSGNAGTGGTGGGGNGALRTNGPGTITAGTANTGGGGGGGTGQSPAVTGREGGSGIVIIRYADNYDPATSTTGSPTVTVSGGYRIYKFTSSGSITF